LSKNGQMKAFRCLRWWCFQRGPFNTHDQSAFRFE